MGTSRRRFRAAPVLAGVALTLATAAAAVPLAGGSAPSPPAVGSWSPVGGRPGADEHLAEAEAARALALVEPAPGWAPAPPSPLLSGPTAAPATPNLVDAVRFWTAGATWASVLAWVQGHQPTGSTGASGAGTTVDHGVVEESDVEFGLPVASAAIQSEQVSVAVAPIAGGKVGIRADAEVIWYPDRPPAETVPAGEDVVTAAVTAGISAGSTPTLVALQTFTAPDVLTRLAREIDGLPLQIPGVRSCPAGLAGSPRLTLVFRGAGGVPGVTVVDDTSGCGDVTFDRGGEAEPPMEDNGLFHLVDAMLDISLRRVDPSS
ncbi:MAG TPA: hypothetical protein VMB82_11615 [Acidimicrobiales bacterium]|nr:hypothetical protein [Acidimicrobiales bacterium]